MDQKKLELGSTILTVGYIGLLLVSFIISRGADLTTAQGRHLLAGALANASFSFVQIIIVNYALRKGERWAWWTNIFTALIYGVPILIVDAIYVPITRLFTTLAPQVAGLFTLGTGILVSGIGLFGKEKSKNG